MSRSHGKTAIYIGFVIMILSASGCSKHDSIMDSPQIIGSSTVVSESRTVGSFTGIQITSFANVFVTQDTVESLRIESNDNIIGRVRTSLNGTTLVVDLQEGSYSNVTVNVYASMKKIKLLESIGSATFSSMNSILTDSITCKITGAGSVTLTGKTNYENVIITGSGEIHNAKLISSFCTVTISGTGNVEAQVTQQLNAMIAGTGTVVYTGNPAVIQKVITGTGVIRAGQ
jgi:hypothetical protein